MTDLVKEGKVRYIGVSNFPAWRLAKALEIADRYGLAKELNATNTQIVYNWLVNSTPSVIPIVVSSNKDQFCEALNSLNLELSPEQMNQLNNAGI